MFQPYVSLEGPIGAGKTTLAGMLASHTAGELLLEDVDGNPFLADFYEDRSRWALPMQQWFLITRWQQLRKVAPARARAVICDYSAHKDQVFADLLLRSRELALYDALAQALSTIVVQPSLVVYIDAPNDVLLERIAIRGRSYENEIDSLYLDSVRSAYEGFWARHPNVPIYRHDTSALDLTSNSQMTHLFAAILSAASAR